MYISIEQTTKAGYLPTRLLNACSWPFFGPRWGRFSFTRHNVPFSAQPPQSGRTRSQRAFRLRHSSHASPGLCRILEGISAITSPGLILPESITRSKECSCLNNESQNNVMTSGSRSYLSNVVRRANNPSWTPPIWIRRGHAAWALWIVLFLVRGTRYSGGCM